MLFATITLPAAPGLAHRFALTLGGLCETIAARMARPATLTVYQFRRLTRRDWPIHALLMLLHARLRRAVVRFTRLASRAATGTWPPPRRKAAHTPARTSGLRPPGLPRGVGWLMALVPGAAVYGSQLQHLLADPDMAALLSAAPQSGRIMKPLCRMLAIPDPIPPPPATQAAESRPPAGVLCRAPPEIVADSALDPTALVRHDAIFSQA